MRIPHNFNPIDPGIGAVTERLISSGYKTVFVFESLYSNVLDIEINNFDSSALIFLNNINEVIFELDQYVSITSNRKWRANKQSVQIFMNNTIENWLVVHETDKNQMQWLF